jgi:hypothetical protein
MTSPGSKVAKSARLRWLESAGTWGCAGTSPAGGVDKEDVLAETTRDAFRSGDCATLLIKARFAG